MYPRLYARAPTRQNASFAVVLPPELVRVSARGGHFLAFFAFLLRGVAKVRKHRENPSGKPKKITLSPSVGVEFSKSCFKSLGASSFSFRR